MLTSSQQPSSHQYTFKGTLYPKIEKNTSFMLSFELDLQSSYGDHCEDERPPSNIMKLSGTCKTCGGNFHVSFSQSAAYRCTDEPRIFHITYIWFNVWPGWAVMLLSDCSSLPSMFEWMYTNRSCMKPLQKAFVVFGAGRWYLILSYMLVFLDSWKLTELLRFSNEVLRSDKADYVQN